MAFENKVAIVTGAARGIGRACAERLAAGGAHVVVADIDADAGAAAAEGLPDGALFIDCDVGERLDIRNMVAQTVDKFGRIDILVNNAAINHKANFLDLEEEDFDRVLKVNLKGSFLVGQAVARQMVDQVEADEKPGAIVNLSSINAEATNADQLSYAVSKGGVRQLTKAMALALAPWGIRVNAVGPGTIRTDMNDAALADDGHRRRTLSRTPLGRLGEAREIAAVAAFLASEDASYITGQTVYADGGRLSLNGLVEVEED